jgi:cobalt-zinc-cadmium efflux system protein
MVEADAQTRLHHAHPQVPPRIVFIAFVITLAAASGEFAGSWYGGSFFLFSDAVHLIAHLGIFAVLLIPAARWHERGEELVSLVVLGVVVLIALGIVVSSGRALLATEGALPNPASMGLAVLGLGSNLTTAVLFAAPSKNYWSFRAALAHELSDGALTIVGLGGALAIHLFGWHWVDPVLSLLIGLWLCFWAGRLLFRRARRGREAWILES